LKWEQTYATVEDERIRNHLENTEVQMRKVDCSNMSDEMKLAREEKINLLHEYWKMGKFPINTEHKQKYLPHIKDEFGTPCAMAYLIEESGDKQLVQELQKTNNVFIEDVHEGKLIDWIITSGITKEEACQIQPSYSFRMNCIGRKLRVRRDDLFQFDRNISPRELLSNRKIMQEIETECDKEFKELALNDPRRSPRNLIGDPRKSIRIKKLQERGNIKERVLRRRAGLKRKQLKSFKEALAVRQARKKEVAKSRRRR